MPCKKVPAIEAFSEKEKAYLKTDAVKYNLLEKLKDQNQPESFVSPGETKRFLHGKWFERVFRTS